MVPGYLVAFPAALRRALHDVDSRAVVALHVEIAGGEPGRLSIVQVARDRERLEKHFRHYHRATEVEDYAPVVKCGQRRGEPPEIPVARVSDSRAVGGGVLVNDLRAESGMDGE